MALGIKQIAHLRLRGCGSAPGQHKNKPTKKRVNEREAHFLAKVSKLNQYDQV
jgi:hypothetical protein